MIPKAAIRAWVLILLLGLVVFSFGPGECRAEQITLKVAFAHWPPWKIIEGREISGIDAEMVRLLGRKMGIKIQFLVCPWRRCIEFIKTGQADLITSYGRRPNREEFCRYFLPAYAGQRIVIYQAKDRPQHIGAYQDLLGKKIGTIAGSTYFRRFEEDAGLIRVPVKSESQLFKMLKAGRLDVMLGFEKAVDRLLIIEGYTNSIEKIQYHPDEGQLSHLAMSRKSKHIALAPKIERIYREIVESGRIKEIVTQYFNRLKERQK